MSNNELTAYSDYEEWPLGTDDGGLTQTLGDLQSLVESSERTLNAASEIAGMYKECFLAEQRTKQVQEWSKVELARTVAKFKTAQDFMEKTFGERDKALTRHYDLLDKAVASGDRDMILASLQGISSIVTKSPLDDFDKFVELYNDASQPLLDF